LAFALLLLALIGDPVTSRAQHVPEPAHRSVPYGHFCPKGSGPYGARRPVRTADEAKCMVETSLSTVRQTVRTGKIEEKEWYYEVQILNRDGTAADCIAVDKRTGRMRSIY
jgi:hypothetical protein